MTLPELGGEADLVEIHPSGLFSDELSRRSVAEFGGDGAWLLLSVLSYGWRTYFDLAASIAAAPAPHEDPARPIPVDAEFQIVKDLQIQTFLYSAAEQFAGLVRAARVHEPGTTRLFESYVEHKTISTLIAEIADLSRPELDDLIGVPQSMADLSSSDDEQPATRTLLGPKSTEVVDVGGLLVPRSAIQSEARAGLFRSTQELADLILTNIGQLNSLVLTPDAGPAVPRAQPLREVDNAFRHGHRVLFHGAVPEVRRFRSIATSGEVDTHAVDLYMPKGTDTIRFATVYCSPARTAEHLEALRQISLRTGQFVRGLLGWKALGTRGLFAASVSLELDATTSPPGEVTPT